MQDESYENTSHHRLGSTGMLSAVTLNFLSYSVASENREYIQTATVTVAAFIIFFVFFFLITNKQTVIGSGFYYPGTLRGFWTL